MPSNTQIIIGVPGIWHNRSALVQAIASSNIASSGNGFIFAGAVLMDIATRDTWQVEIYPPDPRLLAAFVEASQGTISPDDLAAIASHTMTVYLTGEGGSTEVAQKTLDAGTALLRAGGLAVKVESTGKAHDSKSWQAMAESGSGRDLFTAFVTYLYDGDDLYSCGMHNLGLPDAVVPAPPSNRDRGFDLEIFLLYTLIERPNLEDNHTFSHAVDAPRYRLNREASRLYPKDDPFHNPYGVWRLSPI